MYIATIDYETKGIEARPKYPPEPVGVAIKARGRVKYFAWGHASGNNCDVADVLPELREHYANARCIFHNCAFDIDVGETWLDLPVPNVYDDTEFLAFLNDPRERSLALKPLAEKYLDMPPDEQDELKEWILANVPEAKRKPSQWGAHIWKAPGDLVARYAKGDVVRTEKLYKFLRPKIAAGDMDPPYERELALVRVKLKMERHGIQTRHRKLAGDLGKYRKAYDDVSASLRRKLKVTKTWERENCKGGEFNIGSPIQLADALERAGLVDDWIYTEKGNRSTSVDNLKQCVNDKRFLNLFAVYSTLGTYINTFLGPWLETGRSSGGRIYPTFNQVRTNQEHGDFKSYGTKTGRPSVSNPNFNNLPANITKSKNRDTLVLVRDYLAKYGVDFIGLRDYIAPSKGNYLIGRDYAQQELRVLAHYEDGALMTTYQDNPRLDIHSEMALMIWELTGTQITRDQAKAIAFGLIYGLGLEGLAERLGTSYDEAKDLKRAYLDTIPGVKNLNLWLKDLARNDKPLRTWGGRLYYCEPDKIINGVYRSFEYRLINLLIQGTSADITKDAMLEVDQVVDGSVIMQIYDEIVVDTPNYKRDLERMRVVMERPRIDVPLPTDAEYSRVSWARMRDYKDPK